MDAIDIASREEYIKQLEAEIRQLRTDAESLQREIQLRDDMIAKLQKQAGQEWMEVTAARDKRILELERENASQRKQADANLAIARSHRDNYDALCNELGGMGIDIPALRKGTITVEVKKA